MTQITRPPNPPTTSLPTHSKPFSQQSSHPPQLPPTSSSASTSILFPPQWQISLEAQLSSVVRHALVHRGWSETDAQIFHVDACAGVSVAEMVHRIETGNVDVEFVGVEPRRVMQRMITKEVNARLEGAERMLREEGKGKERRNEMDGTKSEAVDDNEKEDQSERVSQDGSWGSCVK